MIDTVTNDLPGGIILNDVLVEKGKENKQEGQCAQSKGWLLVFVICGFILIKPQMTKFLFHIENSSWQNL